jgi:hypothetical protein
MQRGKAAVGNGFRSALSRPIRVEPGDLRRLEVF